MTSLEEPLKLTNLDNQLDLDMVILQQSTHTN